MRGQSRWWLCVQERAAPLDAAVLHMGLKMKLTASSACQSGDQ